MKPDEFNVLVNQIRNEFAEIIDDKENLYRIDYGRIRTILVRNLEHLLVLTPKINVQHNFSDIDILSITQPKIYRDRDSGKYGYVLHDRHGVMVIEAYADTLQEAAKEYCRQYRGV